MRQVSLLTLLFAFFALPASAQNCGCEDEGNCPFTIPPNTATQVCYEITDAFNNDLSDPAQGVCGVAVNFQHQFVANLELTLTSPSGQQVQLTGTNDNCNPFTLLSNWNVLFVPCGEVCMPDTINNCALPCIWDNCPANCNWPNALMTGSYYPFGGCLEDFDAGPANGQWCLDIVNNATFNGGTILDFQVILCDDSGILCCEADAGNLAFEPDVAACEGDSALQLSPNPLYGAVIPDSTEYGYTYTIFSNGNLEAYDSLTDLSTYPIGSYQICGLSYRWADSLSLPAIGTSISASDIFDNLTGPNPDFCGDIDTNCITVLISEPSPPANLVDTICNGDTVWIGSIPYTETGIFSDTLDAFGGCDSVVNLDLLVLLPDTTELVETICNSENFTVGTDTFGMNGSYEVLFQNQFGCDSLVLLDLTVLPPIDTLFFDTICMGDTRWIGSEPYTETGIFTDTIPSFFNCDSIVTLNLTVVEVSLSIDMPDTLTCVDLQVGLSANASTTLGSLNYTWTHTTPPGTGIVSGANLPTPTVDEPGNYVLTIESQGCNLTDSVQVVQDIILPTAIALNTVPNTLTCTVTSVQIDGSSSSGNGSLEFDWVGPGFTSEETSPFVSQPGSYLLTVTDLDNGCADTASVTVALDTIAPLANAGPDAVLSCTQPSLLLDGNGSTSSSGSLEYDWAGMPGNILPPANIATPLVDEPGTYLLTVTDPANGCTDLDSVVITVDSLSPQAVIEFIGGDTLNCVNDIVALDGSNSLNTQNATFEWIGNIATGQGTDLATVIVPGDVSLVITDTVNGCSDTATVAIIEYLNTPIVEAGQNQELDCIDNTAVLDGNGPGTSIGSNFSYQWTSSPGGSFAVTPDSILTEVDSGATYYLTVTEIFSGCTAIDSLTVTENFFPLLANAGPDGLLDCQDTTFLLDGTASVLSGFTNETWVNSAGTVISNEITVTVNYPDTFFLILQEALYCSDTDMVVVTLGNLAPTADAGADLSLDCNTGQATLDGSNSTQNPNVVYEWTTNDGIIFSGENTLTPTVDSAGTYMLSVTDTTNGCTALDTALVTLDSVACLPLVDAGADGSFNCYSLTFSDTLQASGSIGPNISYEWFAIPPTSTILDQADPFAPIVSAGTYVFAVTNDAVGLTALDTVLVVPDTTDPIVNAGPFTLELTCPELASCYPIDVTGTSTGPNFSYLWQTVDGTICTDPAELNAEVLGPGLYDLMVVNLDNGCDAFDAVNVQLLDFPPGANAGITVEMACGAADTTLMGAATPLGGDLTFNWFSPSGNVISGGNTLNPTVSPNNTVDTFFLVVENNVNMCQDTDFVVVFAPANCNPICNATVDGVLDCNTDTVTLSAAGSSTGADITYQWVALTGNLCGSDTTPTTCADQAGIYELTVTRTYPNGAPFHTSCQVQVFDNSQPPVADAGPDDDLNCVDTTLTLDGTGSGSGPNIVYLWTQISPPGGGGIISGETTTTPTVDQPGDYEILVTDTSTGCTATDVVTIGLDLLEPTSEAGPDGQITCSSNSTVLTGSGTPAAVTFEWTTNDGDVCGNPNLSSTIVCAAGTYYLTVTNQVNGCTAIDSTMVDADDDVPEVDVGPDLQYTCVDTVFIIQAMASGVGVLELEWIASNGGCIVGPTDVLQPTVNCPGTYTLTVEDVANGCIATGVVEVIDNTEPPVADAGMGAEINCQNLQVQLDGNGSTSTSGSLDFNWTTIDGNILPPANVATPLVDSAGTYTLIVTDPANQCMDTAEVDVTIDSSIPIADAGPDTTLTCDRLDLDLNGNGSTTGADVFYQWTALTGNIFDGETTLTPTIDATGTYVLEVTDTSSLCVVTDTVEVTLDVEEPTAVIDLTGNFVITCDDPMATLNGSQSTPVGNVSWQWSTQDGSIFAGANAPNATVDSAGTYVLTVTHGRTGCTDSASISVTEDLMLPFVQVIDAQQLTCDSTTVQLEALPPDNQPIYEFLWNGPGIVSGIDTPTPMVGAPGLYGVTITNTLNGCEGDSSVLVTQNVAPPTAIANAIGQLDCDNLTALVTGEGSTEDNVTFQWATTSSGIITTPNAMTSEVDAPGWYFLTVKKLDNGCTAIDSAQVIANSLPIDDVLISLDHPDCTEFEGFIAIDSVIGGTPPYYYQLDDDIFITFPLFNYLDPGPYVITVEDVNGCSWETEVSLLLPNEILVELGTDLYLRQGESTTLEAQVSIPESEIETITWTGLPDSVSCPTCLVQEVIPDETTTYRILVIDSTGCSAEDRVTIFVDEQRPFYVPTAFSPNGDNANDRLMLYAGKDVANVPTFRIFDRWGNMVFFKENYQPNNPSYGWDGNFEGQPMNPAVFVWKAEVEFVDGEVEVFYGEFVLVR